MNGTVGFIVLAKYTHSTVTMQYLLRSMMNRRRLNDDEVRTRRLFVVTNIVVVANIVPRYDKVRRCDKVCQGVTKFVKLRQDLSNLPLRIDM